MPFSMRPIGGKTKGLDAKRYQRAVENALDGIAKDMRVDFNVTTQTWQQQPEFTIEKAEGSRTVGTDNEIYGYVNDGTRPHIIAPKRGKALAFGVGGHPKTRPNVIGSSAGSQGTTFVTTRGIVQHPGTAPRNFAKAIAEKWRKQARTVLQRAIDAEAR